MEMSCMGYSPTWSVLAPLGMVALVACGGATEGPYAMDQRRLVLNSPVSDVISPDAERYGEVRFVRYINGEGREGELDRPIYIGYDGDGERVLVVERKDCLVKFIDWKSGLASHNPGRCGQGPGELEFVLGASVRADTMFMLEAATGFWKVLNTSGTEYYRYRIQDSFPEFYSVLDFVGGNEHTLALIFRRMANLQGAAIDSWGYHIAVITDGKVAVAPIRASEAAARVVEGGGAAYYNLACMSPDFHLAESGYIAVAQPFAFESVVLDRNLSPFASSSFAPQWLSSRRDSVASLLSGHPADRGPELTVGDRVYIVCGPSFYAVSARAFEGRDPRVEDVYGVLEVRKYGGELIARRVWYGGVGGGQMGSPRAIVGDTLVTMTIDRVGNLRLAAWTFEES
jgi:hypothetical protein